MVGDKGVLEPAALEKLREAKLNEAQLAKMVLELSDEIVASPKLMGQNLDINIVRALLYLQRCDPRIDQRVRQYLYGRQLTDLSVEAVAALDPNTGEGRAFEIIESLGRLMWTVDRAALVFCIDQVEDLRFFDDYQERLQKAARSNASAPAGVFAANRLQISAMTRTMGRKPVRCRSACGRQLKAHLCTLSSTSASIASSSAASKVSANVLRSRRSVSASVSFGHTSRTAVSLTPSWSS